jgi:hypothetical protein
MRQCVAPIPRTSLSLILKELCMATAVDKQVQQVLDKAPETFVFAPDGPLYVLADTRAALPWVFGPVSGPAVARGVDIATIADGRTTSVLTVVVTSVQSLIDGPVQ